MKRNIGTKFDKLLILDNYNKLIVYDGKLSSNEAPSVSAYINSLYSQYLCGTLDKQDIEVSVI